MNGKLQIRTNRLVLGMIFCVAFLVTLGFAPKEVHATAATANKEIVIVNAPNVNVRSQPSTTGTSYGKLAQNTFLVRYEMRPDGWSCIDYAGVPAYVMTQYLTPYVAAAPAQSTVPTTPGSGSGIVTPTVPALPTTPAITTPPATGGAMVWIPNSGKKYHSRPNCSKMKNPSQVTLDAAVRMGYEPCKVCH